MPNHSVTVTRTITSSSSSAIVLNVGFVKDLTGILKLLELVIGIICVGISAHYSTYWSHPSSSRIDYRVDLVFILVAVACLITTFLLVFSSLISLSTASILPKTAFEYVYHGMAFFLYLIASIAYVIELQKRSEYGKEYDYDIKLAAAILGLVNSCLYLISTLIACRRN